MRDVTLVRDVAGAVTAVLPDHLLNEQERDLLAESLHDTLGGYSPGIRSVLLEHSELVDLEDILASPYRVQIPEEAAFLVDRMLTNQEWLREPITDTLPFPTAVAFSIKGGVGRSTALAAWAWGLAKQGKRVLVVDLDLEAPGISSLLLDVLPKYGLLDWLVESLAQQAGRDLLEDMLATSPLSSSQECDGTIQVIPACGSETKDYIAKLGRIFLPTMGDNGELYGLAHRLKVLLETIAQSLSPPDVVLLDARAGLHDIGAAVLSQLPTEIFLFARDDRQTWEAYQHLFQHLTQSRCVTWGMPDRDLRWRLNMVAAQLGVTKKDLDHAVGASCQVWTTLYDDDGSEARSFLEFEEDAPHFPIPIYFVAPIARKSLADTEERPAWEMTEQAFGKFITVASERLFPSQDAADGH